MKLLTNRGEWLIAVIMSLIIVVAFQSIQLQYLKKSYLKNIQILADNQKTIIKKETKIFELISKILTYQTKIILKHEKILDSKDKIKKKRSKNER